MPIDGKCPRCGFKAPLISFEDAAENGQFLLLYAQLPPAVQKPYLKYLSLFRPSSGCSMQSSKADRLTRDFLDLAAKAFVSEKGKVDRPCSPALWAMGMERMQEQAASLTLPMKSHNYLRTIVYSLADQADAGREKQVITAERTGSTKIQRPGDDEMSPEMRRYIAENGDPLANPALQDMMEKMKARQGEINAAD